MIDATFWVGVSFFIFLGLLVYFGIPNRIKVSLDQLIQKIKSQVDEAESLKEEANNLLSESEKKLSNAKREIKEMMVKANEDTEKLILKTNSDFHKVMENRKRGAEERIAQMKDQALRDIKRTSVQIAMISIENLLKNSIDKNKLEKIYQDSIEETKLALKRKSN